MSKEVNLHHLVLKIQNNKETLDFYSQFFDLLQLKKIYTYQNSYWHFANKKTSIGLNFEPDYISNLIQVSGLGHIAFEINSNYLWKKLHQLIYKFQLKIEVENKATSHAGEDFLTTCFYCPSNLRLEVIKV